MKPEEMVAGLQAGTHLLGFLRINSKKRSDAYVPVQGVPVDIFIDGDRDRNRALESDLVVIELQPQSAWRPRTGRNGAPLTASPALAPAAGAAATAIDDADADGVAAVAAAVGRVSLGGAAAATAATAVTAHAHPHHDEDNGVEELDETGDADNVAALTGARAQALNDKLYQPVLRAAAASGGASSATTSPAGDGDAAAAGASGATPVTSPSGPSSVGVPVIPPVYASAMAHPNYTGYVRRVRDATAGGTLQPLGRVVGIALQRHNRSVVGTLRPAHDDTPLDRPIPDRDTFVRLVPLDVRVPYVLIARTDVPDKGFFEAPGRFSTQLYAASIGEWRSSSRFPQGIIHGGLGEAGEIATETRALIYEHGVRDEPFSDAVMGCLTRFMKPDPAAPAAPAGAAGAAAALPPWAAAASTATAVVAGGAAAATAATTTAVVPAAASSSSSAAAVKAASSSWRIQPEELARRRDYRRHRIMTIDPTTAKDLDDAIHITDLGGDVYEVGVHIADVSWFVTPGNALDSEASARATSTYLVQRVIPMLPALLCEELCSLNPGVDRLAFSCVWKMRGDGTLLEEPAWFGRTVIRSLAKLDYPTAQLFMDDSITEALAEHPEDIPYSMWEAARRPGAAAAHAGSEELLDGAGKPVVHTCVDVVRDCKLMHKVAMARRRRRFAAGALALNKTKLSFKCDPATGNPIAVTSYPIRDSNRVVEEFMLLANYLVAQQLLMTVGPRAFLRCHPPMQADKATGVKQLSSELGIPFSLKTAGTIHNSLMNAYAKDPLAGRVLEYLAVKPMKPAKYFAVGAGAEDDSSGADAGGAAAAGVSLKALPSTVSLLSERKPEWAHYALAMPYYTHFTSPIRRYADILVHRLLAESVDRTFAASCGPAWSLEQLAAQASVCNDRKQAAKEAQERSDIVYLTVLLDKSGPMEGLEAVVCDVAGASFFNILIVDLDIEHKVYLDRCKLQGHFSEKRRTLKAFRIGSAAAAAAGSSDEEEEEDEVEVEAGDEAGAAAGAAHGRSPAAGRKTPGARRAAGPGGAARDYSHLMPQVAEGAAILPSQMPADAHLPTGANRTDDSITIKAMTRFKVRLVADKSRVPINVEVQLQEYLGCY